MIRWLWPTRKTVLSSTQACTIRTQPTPLTGLVGHRFIFSKNNATLYGLACHTLVEKLHANHYQHLWLGQQRGVWTPQVKQGRIALCWFSQAFRWAVLGGDNTQLESCSSCCRGSPGRWWWWWLSWWPATTLPENKEVQVISDLISLLSFRGSMANW